LKIKMEYYKSRMEMWEKIIENVEKLKDERIVN
jgi:hypothetical protein